MMRQCEMVRPIIVCPIMERTFGWNVGALQALVNGLADRHPGIDQLAASK